ncbi:DUF4350 domain-containing protein [Streptomyces sp. NPDC050560]|uniref:DUF4350 domain-containing protein n=1 Tax=Streptomyces sp. NPDC050560 TaxID=3365630 RepID=UPI00379B2D2C
MTTPTATGTTPANPPEPPRQPPAGDGTSASPDARRVWRRSRGLLLAAVVVIAAAVALAAVRSDGNRGRLDPRSADRTGSRAVAELLSDRDVDTRVVTTLAAARAAAGPDTTLLVAAPDLLTHRQRTLLHSAAGDAGGRTVLLAPGPAATGDLAPEADVDPFPSAHGTLAPGCDLPAARRAGSADTGGVRYSTIAAGADACYPAEGVPTLVRIPVAGTPGDTVLVGSPDFLVNDRLDRHGNASLALQLLGSRPHLVWYLPSLSDTSGSARERGFLDLVPDGWIWGTLQLGIAALLTALWRARRLGPLVPERLPVVIRASETAEGRAHLYRRAAARDRAALALRSAARSRLAPLVGTPSSQAHSPEALLPALRTRLGPGAHTPAPDPYPLLFGPPPSDDAALVALADQLDALEREVRQT